LLQRCPQPVERDAELPEQLPEGIVIRLQNPPKEVFHPEEELAPPLGLLDGYL
jgi:hypothetical protein